MNCSLISELLVAGNKVSSATENLNGSERDKPIVVQTGHNPFNCIRPKGVCLSLQSVLERTAKADPNRSRSMVRASLCAGGHTKSSDARGRNDPRASREGGINRNPPPLGVGRFNMFLKLLDWFDGKHIRLNGSVYPVDKGDVIVQRGRSRTVHRGQDEQPWAEFPVYGFEKRTLGI